MTHSFRSIAFAAAFVLTAAVAATTPPSAVAAPACPLSYGSTDAAKSLKLFLYFPTTADATFPAYTTGASPAAVFDVANLNSAIGTTAALRSRIYDVVADDYCEFNVQVISTTTNPATLPSPPPRRVTVAVGSDNPTGAWGQAQETDTGDAINIDFARVWAGTYTTCEGGAPGGAGGCSMTGSLTGANATLDRWAQAIGGTAAHEAGHTYGLAHTDDDPPNDLNQPGPAPLPGEDSFHRHLMPAGYNLTGNDRASYRRHFSDRTYGLLATNVGLSIQTMHNWDLLNPNAAAAHSLRIDFLSPLSAVNVAWSFTGALSPWITPVVSGPTGTAVFKGITYNRYSLTWSVANPSWTTGAPGVVPGGARFHIGATFTGVDFNQPDPVIIQNVTLLHAGSNPLTLHPRLPSYDTGAVDAADGTFALHFFLPPGGSRLRLHDAVIYQLPRVASISSMTGAGRPRTFDRIGIHPWSVRRCRAQSLRNTVRCPIAKITARPHVFVTHKLGTKGVYDCRHGVPRLGHSVAGHRDSPRAPDYEGPVCAGTQRDPFPSTTVYVIATFVDPSARHYDRKRRRYVTGPVISKIYYQFAGVRNIRRLRLRHVGGAVSGTNGSFDPLPAVALWLVAPMLAIAVMAARRTRRPTVLPTPTQ